MDQEWPSGIRAAYEAGFAVWWDEEAGRWVTEPGFRPLVMPAAPSTTAPVARRVSRTDCPRGHRGGFDASATDEHGDPDPHCINCGYRPQRDPAEVARLLADDATASAGKQRRRSPSHAGSSL